MKIKSIFLTNKASVYSEITGGVQLCSQEFLEILNAVDSISFEHYYVTFTKNIRQRILIRSGFENYSMYDVEKDQPALIEYIRDNEVEVVFINMASLVRYAKPIKLAFGEKVKVILMSHGNHSGDFLHLITKPLKVPGKIKAFLNKLRLGLLITTESEYRVKYLDAVIALSETEAQIENWFGAKVCLFLPRRIKPGFLTYTPVIGRAGFVGRLDHPPNYQGMQILLEAFASQKYNAIEIRLVGTPGSYGKKLAEKYKQVSYLGELSDDSLETEVATWAILLNPVWWYSTGASTKLAKAISWGIPIVTTTAGMRGYKWSKGSLLLADTPAQMCKTILENIHDLPTILNNAGQARMVAQNGLSVQDLADMVKQLIN